jgi:Zn-dependent alcohol dehydrogenase
MKVKAVINIDVGGPLVIDDLDIGDPGPTHVIVKQFATGVCHSQQPGFRAMKEYIQWG